MSDGMQYAILAATGGFVGWFGMEIYFWLTRKVDINESDIGASNE